QPPVDPADPPGTLLGAGGHVFYDLTLARFGEGRLVATPLIGAGYLSTRVQSQGAQSIVISSTALDIHAGGRLRWVVSPSFAVESEVRLGWLGDYSESPTITGRDGSGFALRAGAGARYWFSSNFGVSAVMSYRRYQVGFSGLGTRAILDGDPVLSDASVVASDLKLALGIATGF
ncbi:MAG: hypothetical protein AAFV29_13500, partial [Myxococcota bacterium]